MRSRPPTNTQMPFPTDLRWFSRSEFNLPDRMDPPFLRLLDQIRSAAGMKSYITDDFRPNSGNSAHGLGLAVDISDNKAGLAVGSRWRHMVLSAAYAYGIPRIGIYDRHIHLDTAPAPNYDQSVTWIGDSK